MVIQINSETANHPARRGDSDRVEIELRHEMAGVEGGGLEIKGNQRLGHIESRKPPKKKSLETGAVRRNHPTNYDR
jgi:hypothetical protein